MKKFLALVLTLAMVLTLSVGIFASPAAAGSIDVNGKSTVEIGGVTYTVISDLSAVSTTGNYILSGNVAVAKNNPVTFAAGTVLNGNGYTISVAGNNYEAPLNQAPFTLAAGAEIKITNVKFGDMAAEAPFVFESAAPATVDAVASDLSIFVEAGAGVVATFEDVTFSAYAFDEDVNVNTAAVVAVAAGTYNFKNCVAAVELDTGDMTLTEGTTLVKGYTGAFIGSATATSDVTFDACETAKGSIIEADWRTGGFVGGVDGKFAITNCVNNAVITNLALVTGGFVGWVGNDSGNNLTAWTMDGCVNNGEITAYMMADSGRSAGAMVGYVYKNETGTTPQWIVSNCVNTANLYGEDRLAGMVGDNRLTDRYDKSQTLIPDNGGYEYLPAITRGCINYGDVVCTVKDAVSGAHVLGGFFSRTQGPNTLENCVNYGSVNANGMKDGHLGGIIGNTSAGQARCEKTNGVVELNSCANFGLIINGRRLAGLIGASESPTVISGCFNFGVIDSGLGSEPHNGTHTDNGVVAGGIVGLANNGTHTISYTVNAGEIKGMHLGGGIAAVSRANGPFVMTNVANFANVWAGDVEAAGIVAYAMADVTISGAVNTGMITGAYSYVAAQILSRGTANITLDNLYVFGSLHADSMDAYVDGVLGNTCDRGDAITVADGEVLAYVINDDPTAVTDARNVALSATDAYAALQEFFGTDELPVYLIDGAITLINPMLRGAQIKTEAPTNGTTDLRIVGVVDGQTYDKVVFSYKVNGAATATVIDGVAMDDIKAVNYSGTKEEKDAAYMGGSQIYALLVSNIAATGIVTVEVEMIATLNGVEYSTGVTTVTVLNGVIVG